MKYQRYEFICPVCKFPFTRSINSLRRHKYNLSKPIIYKKIYCSKKCLYFAEKGNPNIKVICLNCQKEFLKYRQQIKAYPKNFCSKRCRCQFQQKNKKYGISRSKLEQWIENQLKIIFPNLTIIFNNREIINSELDIYIPSLKLAFELNGIFHYEPIFGKEKLKYIQNNDSRKFQACLEQGIELCVIDTSKFTYFKENKANEYLNIINNIINLKLN
jgi:hypothetical protein